MDPQQMLALLVKVTGIELSSEQLLQIASAVKGVEEATVSQAAAAKQAAVAENELSEAQRLRKQQEEEALDRARVIRDEFAARAKMEDDAAKATQRAAAAAKDEENSLASVGVQAEKLQEQLTVAQAKLAALKANPELVLQLKAVNAELKAMTTTGTQGIQTLSGEIRDAFPTLLGFRTLIRSITALFAIGFVIEEWGTFVNKIKEVSLAMGGFGEAAQKAAADDVTANEKALAGARTLKESHDLINDTLREQSDLTNKQAVILDRTMPAWANYLGIVGAAMAGDVDTAKELINDMSDLADISNQEAVARARLLAQQKHDEGLRRELARSNIEVLKAESDVLDSSGKKSAALSLKIAASYKEEDEAISEVAGKTEIQNNLHIIYAARRLELLNQLSAVREKVHHESMDQLAELLQREKDEQVAFEQQGNARVEVLRRYQSSLREINDAEQREREEGRLGAEQIREAWQARTIAANIYLEQLRQIDEADKEKARREEEAAAKQGLKQGEKTLVEPWMRAQEAVGKYAEATMKAADADEIAASRVVKNAVQVAYEKLQEEIKVTESGKREALALDPFNKAYQATVNYAEQQRLAAAFKKEQSTIQEVVEQTTEKLKAKTDAEEESLDRLRTPHAQALLQAFRELQQSKEHYDATMKEVTAARQLAASLQEQAKKEEDVAKSTNDAAQAAQKAADAKQKEKQATDLLTQAAKSEKQAKVDAALADAEAVASAAANLLTTLGYRKQAAIVEAIMQTAAGIADLAVYNFEGAALHFLSAAEYGIIAGQTPSRGATVGQGTRGGQAPGSPGPLSAGATGSQVPLTPGLTSIGGSPTLHVLVMGPPEAAQYLANTLNTGQDRYGVTLKSNSVPKAGR